MLELLTREQRSQRARIAALTRWSQESGQVQAHRGQDGFLRKFFNETDPGLPEDERWRRAECARRAHMQRLAYRRERARARRKAASPDGGRAA